MSEDLKGNILSGSEEKAAPVQNPPARRLSPGRLLVASVFALALLVFLDAPVLAVSWSSRPFLGFVVEPSLVVSNVGGVIWNAQRLSINHPERITHLDGRAVETSEEYLSIVSNLTVGEPVEVWTVFPDGTQRKYPSVRVNIFSPVDQVLFFWLPYLVGLVYLAIGGLIYRLRGDTSPGQVFAFFCASIAVVMGLYFDLISTHAGSILWTIALAQVGGAVISLALVFPEELFAGTRYTAVRYLPILVSLGLAVWGVVAVVNYRANPWEYIAAWRFKYLYAALGILVFIGVMLYRQATSQSAVARQQARVILWGSLFAFTPVVVWMTAPLFGFDFAWNPAIFVPFLLLFPMVIAIAILRYRLWDIDVIVNRTLVYGVLSLLLALVYFLTVLVTQQIFRELTGETSSLAAVVSTLVIVAIFNPLRRDVQVFIDRRFYRRKYDIAKTLEAFTQTLQEEVDLDRVIQRLESVIWETILPAHIHVWLRFGDSYSVYRPAGSVFEQQINPILGSLTVPVRDPLVAYFQNAPQAVKMVDLELESAGLGKMNAAGVEMIVPFLTHGELLGWLSLGAHLSGQEYSADDRILLSRLAIQAAPSVRVAQLVAEQQAETLKRERLEQELALARRIQVALLPKEMPDLCNWRMATHYQPARTVGGDFYDFVNFDDGRLGIFIGDVTDKGIPAALVMATTRTMLRAVAHKDLTPGETLRRVNDLLQVDIPANMFVTCLYAILEPETGELVYANAGHNLPYCHTRQGVVELRATGMPLGLMVNMIYENQSSVLEPGDCAIFYSDGLVEAHNAQGEMFGTGRLIGLLEDEYVESASLIDRLLKELGDFTGVGWEQEDDITLVGVKRGLDGDQI